MPVIGFGTAVGPPVNSAKIKLAVMQAIEIDYRHFDTAALFYSEQPPGEANTEPLIMDQLNPQNELFITSKLWCSDAAHPQDFFLPKYGALMLILKHVHPNYALRVLKTYQSRP